MRFIPPVFQRNDAGRLVDRVTPGCEWVTEGQGVATRQHDGVAVAFMSNAWWLHHMVPVTEGQPTWLTQPPTGFIEEGTLTGVGVYGWVPLMKTDPLAPALEQALAGATMVRIGTYELLGPTINGNRENRPAHMLVWHRDAEALTPPPPRDFHGLRRLMTSARFGWRGIVFRHEDGVRLAKVRAKDFEGARRG